MDLLSELLTAGRIPWRRWDEARATRDGRPWLVFAGTALDHWSSRLAAELNAGHEIAAALAEVFTCVVVEVASEPGPAARIQQALALTAAADGWPAVAVCTPDGQPFGALPWRPLPDLAQRLLAAAEAWLTNPGDCLADASRLTAAWAARRQPAQGRPVVPGLILDAAEAAAMELADPLAGGFGPAPRTAEPALWGFLIARAARTEAPFALSQQLERSLAALVAGCVHDHFGGGFFRGCADPGWQQPFCEKSLAVQAHTAGLLLIAADRLGRAVWRDVALRALDFTVGSLRLADGSYAHGLHADSPAAPGRWEEGVCYRWTIDEVAAVVGEEGADLIHRRFGLPGIPGLGETLDQAGTRRLPELVQRLAVARSERAQPRRDATVLADEQGLIAWTLEQAGMIDVLPPLTGNDPWTGRALAARWRRTGIPEPRALAIGDTAWDEDSLDPPGGLAPVAVHAHLALDLADLTGDAAWRQRAAAAVANAGDRLRAAPLAGAGLLSVLDRLVAEA
jgi:uncharacterized protein